MTASPQAIDLIEVRLQQVESENRRIKRILALGAAVLMSALTMGAVVQDRTVEANRFVLTDSSGHVRAELTMDFEDSEYSTPALRFYREEAPAGSDSPGEPSFQIREDSLVFWAPGQVSSVSLGNIGGHGSLHLGDVRRRVEEGYISLTSGPGASMRVYGPNGSTNIDDAALSLWHNDTRAVRLSAEIDVGPSFRMEGRDGESLILETTLVQIRDTEEEVLRRTNSLILYDETGAAVWYAP